MIAFLACLLALVVSMFELRRHKADLLDVGDALEKERDEARARVADLEKCLAAATKMPISANGKTPGQVDYEAYGLARFGSNGGATQWSDMDPKTKAHNEAGAEAVLRAFGNGAEAPRLHPLPFPDVHIAVGPEEVDRVLSDPESQAGIAEKAKDLDEALADEQWVESFLDSLSPEVKETLKRPTRRQLSPAWQALYRRVEAKDLDEPIADPTERAQKVAEKCSAQVQLGHCSVCDPLPICTCPASSEYDRPCQRHGVLGIGITGR